MRPHILITNDDGIHAPGIKHLWKGLVSRYDVTVIAPATEQSGVGLGLTTREPLRIQQHNWGDHTNVWSVSGTPADCVKLAFSTLMADNPPTLVVSGMNRGSNAGGNVLYSGTVAGAIEGVLQGLPAIAFSCYDYFDTDYLEGEKHAAKIVQHVLKNPLPNGTLLNVTFPQKDLYPLKGFKMARQGREVILADPEKRTHPTERHDYYWLGYKMHYPEEADDSEITWLRKGYCTASPLHVRELTDRRYLNETENHFNGISIE